MRSSLAAVLLVAALAGCAAAPSEPEASPDASASPSPSASPTLTVDAEPVQDPADPSTWIIDAGGIGPYRLGDPFDAAVASSPAFAAGMVKRCEGESVAYVGTPGDNEYDTPVLVDAGPDGVVRVVSIGELSGPSTVEGIAIGSTVAEVRAAYPDLVEGLLVADVPRYTVQSPTGWISFGSSSPELGESAPITGIAVVTGGNPYTEYCA